MRQSSTAKAESLAFRVDTHAGIAEARARLKQRSVESLADFIVSLAQNESVGAHVRTFIVEDDVAETVVALQERIAQLEPPSEYELRHARGQEIGVRLELILDGIERLLPMDPRAAFDLLIAVYEADQIAKENCGDHDWEVACAYDRAAQLMGTAAKLLPGSTVVARLRELVAADGYGERAPLTAVLRALESP